MSQLSMFIPMWYWQTDDVLGRLKILTNMSNILFTCKLPHKLLLINGYISNGFAMLFEMLTI